MVMMFLMAYHGDDVLDGHQCDDVLDGLLYHGNDVPDGLPW